MNKDQQAQLEAAYRKIDWAKGARTRLILGTVGVLILVPSAIAYVSWLIVLSADVATPAQATVTSLREKEMRSSGGGVTVNWCPMLRFPVGQHWVEHENRYCTEDRDKFRVGQTVAVEYDPADPSLVVTASAWDKYADTLFALPIFGVGGFFLWAVWAGYFNFRRKAAKYGQAKIRPGRADAKERRQPRDD